MSAWRENGLEGGDAVADTVVTLLASRLSSRFTCICDVAMHTGASHL